MKPTRVFFLLCAILHVWLAYSSSAQTNGVFYSADTPLPERVAQSSIIAYAVADTNKAPDILVVAGIWKGTNDARSLGITNGMPFRFRWPEMMDAAVLFFPSGSSGPEALRPSSIYAVRAGRISGMTTNEFRTRFGLR